MLRQECALRQAIIPLFQALFSPLPWASLLSARSFYLWAEVVEATEQESECETRAWSQIWQLNIV